MDIAAWLRELGLERYVQAFRDQEIDDRSLPHLTGDDLKDLGVMAIGHRRLLLEAIAALAEPALAPQAEPSAPAEAAARARPAEAERRQLTVLFCDLVGSTELSARLDPEDLRDVMQVYHAACGKVVGQFEGHIAKFLGDGVLAYFGWPQAHEDDAERAVRAGLALVAAVGGLDARLQARVGIATGTVVVGDQFGEGAAREEAVVGDVPNLAARLQALAQLGGVVIGEATQRLIGGLFELGDLGPRHLKGFAESLPAWRISGESQAEGRFEARHGAGLTPLVGREEEIALLLRRWRQAREGEGQVVLLSGEPGIGKSRLVRELRARLESEPHVRLLYQCSPHHTTSPLHPLIQQLEHAAGFEHDDPPEVKLDKLETLLSRGTDRLDQAVPLIVALLDTPTGERYPLPELTPQRQKQRTLEVLVEQLEGLSADQPVLLAYEDVHWIDPTTQELLELAIERIQRLPVLAIITFRPGFSPPWSGQPHVSALALTRLGGRDGAALVDRVVGAKSLPAEVAAQIVAKTDGVPLFVEELTKTVLESGVLQDAGDRWELSGPLPPLAIPSTLHDSLLARLDRLAPVKEVAQIGAAIGREFSHALLAAAADRPEAELRAGLDQLVSSELVFRRGTPPEVTYSFKHALVRDTAYATLLRGKRRRIHGRIAAALLELRRDSPPEVIAHHLTEAGQGDAAVEFWARAAGEAVSRAASKEAVAYFRRALAQLSSLPDTAERNGREAVLQSALGGALVNVTGPGSEALEQAYVRIRDLCQQTGDTKAQFVAEWNLWHVHTARAEYRQAQALSKHLIRVAEQKNDPDLLLQALHVEWSTLSTLGEHEATQACRGRGWALYDPERHGTHHLIYGAHDPGVCSRIQGAFATWFLGQPDQARAWYEQGLALARRLNHPQVLVHALVRGLPLFELCRDRERLAAQAETAFALSAEQDFADHGVEAQIHRSWAVGGDEREPALRVLQRALRERQGSGSMWNNPYYLLLLARAQARVGVLDDALATLKGALEHARSTGEAWIEPELLRTHGEFLLEKDNAVKAAERLFGAALAQARATSARAWELRSATSLARLWVEGGRRRRARDLLAPVYNWFTEGFDTPDLKDAKALLDDLR